MTYRVRFPRNWDRQLRRLPNHVAERAQQQADSLADNPRPRGYRQLQPSGDGYRIKVFNDWRLVYDIDDDEGAVFIERVVSRGKVRY